MDNWLIPLGITLGIVVFGLTVGFIVAMVYPR